MPPRPLSDFSAKELADIRAHAEAHPIPGVTQHGPGLCGCYPQCYIEADEEDRRELGEDYWKGQAFRAASAQAEDEGHRPWWRPF